ncbi:MAG TPA: glycosyltransferase family 1 protein [Chloroflexota bacterium]
MRIGFEVTPLTSPHSGIGTYAANLLEHLVRRNGDVILPLSPQTGGRLRLNKTVWMQTVLPWALAGDRVDVCHFTNNVAPMYVPCPVVMTIHDMTLWLCPEHHPRQRLLAMRPVIPLAARRAAAIITVSQSAKRDIVRLLGVAESKVHVVYEAPAAQFRPLPRGPALDSLRRQYGLPEHIVLYVGTIEPRKNLVRLLHAFARLPTANASARALVLVGARGWKDSSVFQTVDQLGLGERVRFLGQVPIETLVGLYNLADVLAFPSLYEGFGLPIVEAMACGTAVVTSRSGSLGEIAGNAAEFVEPTDTDSIAHGIQRVLDDDAWRTELRRRGRVRAGAFSWAEAAAQTVSVYRSATRTH